MPRSAVAPALNPANDVPLFRTLRYSLYNFALVGSGTDLYAHKDPERTVWFYLWHWSVVPGEVNTSSIVSEDFAIRFIREMYLSHKLVIGVDHMSLLEYLPKLYWGGE